MSEKTYKCPFCSNREGRHDLAQHIAEEHEELIPSGMSPNQMAFNIINHKTENHGVCVVCKQPTSWNENSCKYNRLCGKESCRKALREMYKKNMVKVHGTTTLLNDPEHQERMLAHRRISGTYRFKDGGRHIYTGSYEQKTLEFLDQVMGFHSQDILSPGPILEYKYKGETLKWITDILIIPLNLIIEVKDGGDNKNKIIDDNVRNKTLAKEEMITNLGKFHYLRLTNNNFEQLIQIIAEIKLQMVDDSKENRQAIIRIHEDVQTLTEAVFSYEERFDTGPALSFHEFEEAKNLMHKICIADPEFKWDVKRSWYNESGLVLRIDYMDPEDVGAGYESNWQELDSYMREVIIPKADALGNFNFRTRSDSAEIGELDVYAKLKSVHDYPFTSNRGFRYEENPLWIEKYREEIGLGNPDKENNYDALKPLQSPFVIYGTNGETITTANVSTTESALLEASGVDKQKYTRKYRNFDEFCKYINTPEEVYNWYMFNKVEWPDEKGKFIGNAKPFAFPDDIVRTHIGNCWDHSNFMAMFCERKGIEFMPLHAIEYCVSKRASKPEWWVFGHAICAFKTEGLGWRLFDYHGSWGKVISSLTGPWPTIKETIKAYKEIYGVFGRMMGNSEYYKRSENIVHEYMYAYDIWKKFYNDHTINQEDLTPIINQYYKKYTDKYWDIDTNSSKDYHFEDPFDMINYYAQKVGYRVTNTWPQMLKEKIMKFFKEETDIENIQNQFDSFHEAVASKYTKSYKNFEEFCKAMNSPYDVNSWYFVNKVRWFTDKETIRRDRSYNQPADSGTVIVWPDELIKTKIGICYDHAILMHFFCQYHNIKNKILLIFATMEMSTFSRELACLGHAVTAYEIKGEGVYIFNYQRNLGSVLGPFQSFEAAMQYYKTWYMDLVTAFRKELKCKIKGVYALYHETEEEFKVYDHFRHDPYTAQFEMLKRFPKTWKFYQNIPRERQFWFEEFIEKFNLVDWFKKTFLKESVEIEEELIEESSEISKEEFLKVLRKNAEYSKAIAGKSKEEVVQIENKLYNKAKKHAQNWKDEHGAQKLVTSSLIGELLVGAGLIGSGIVPGLAVGYATGKVYDKVVRKKNFTESAELDTIDFIRSLKEG